MNYYDGTYHPNSIKIIPMTNNEKMEPEFFNKTITELQKLFFTDRLPYDKYLFRERYIADIEGTLVLFQFDRNIVAAGILEKRILKKTDGYNGYYLLYPDSIIIFDPIDKYEFRKVDSSFVHYGSRIKNVNSVYYETLLKILKQRNIKFCYKNIDQDDEQYQSDVENEVVVQIIPDDEPVEAPDVTSQTVVRLQRNSTVGKQVLEQSNYQCEYVANHRWLISKVTGKNYIGLHHLIPMAFQSRFSYSLDVPSNVVPLCPLCHKILHHGTFEERNPIIRKLHQNRNARLNLCKIPVTIDSLISMY
jgi:hypothetical protein